MSDEIKIFNMRFVKPSAIGLRKVEGREGDADMANMACLGSDLELATKTIGSERIRSSE